MTNLQVYDNLNINIPKKDLTVGEKNKLIELIPLLDQNATDIIYALIKHHNNNDKKKTEYKNKCVKNTNEGTSTLSWNIKDLPIKLRHILYKFVCMEETRMKELDIRYENQIKMKNEHVSKPTDKK